MKKNIIFIMIICLFNLCACSQNKNIQETNMDEVTFKEDVNVITDDVGESSENVRGMIISSALLIKENSVESNIDEKENKKSTEQEIMETASCREQSKYWQEVVEWDEANLRTGMDRPLEPLLSSDQKKYSTEELQKYPEVILYLGLNEIYARHGYIFKDEDLNNYFLGQIWYKPCLESEFFDEEVLNDYERENRSILLKLLGRE